MIRKFLDCSTAHVSDEARDWLNEMGQANAHADSTIGPLAHHVAINNYGWWVYVPVDPSTTTDRFPCDLMEVFEYARRKNCDYILFDCDAGIIEGLPTFE